MGKYGSDCVHCAHLHVKLTKSKDGDIIARLGEVENKQAYIKQLIRKDIASNGDPVPPVADSEEC